MTFTSLAIAERHVPRYTSYPTAPHFTGEIGSKTYAEWLALLPKTASVSLYIHVPFCVELCHYCGCTTKATRSRDPIDAYVNVLRKELDLLQGIGGRKVTHLHWGGGTPSILGADSLCSVVESLARRFDFSELQEHAIELDPRRTEPEIVRALANLGVTRASLGVQDFTPAVQHAMGRVQPFDLVKRVTGNLRDAGIKAINFDLMYGLPNQTVSDAACTASGAASLRPDRIALFGYAHVPWFKTHQRLIDSSLLPGVSERLGQSAAASKTLCDAGYIPVGLDHFALPDDPLAVAAEDSTLRRNFQGYTTDQSPVLIGLGASAIGRMPQGYVQNAPDTAGYSRAINAGTFATVRGVALSEEDRVRAAIIERLMCEFAVDLADFGGTEQLVTEIENLNELTEAGLVIVAGSRITVTESGRPFVRLAAAAFDSYLSRANTQHSIAV